MRRFAKIIGVAGLICGAGVSVLPAQEQNGTQTEVVANPAGAVVYLQGEYGLAGRTPYTIQKNLDGTYRIRAQKWGYETYTGFYEFRPGVSQRISVNLTKKTRGRAAFRSLIFPGWGQRYSDQFAKGWILTSFSLSSLSYLVYRDRSYQSAVDNFEIALTNFQNNENNNALREELLLEVQRRQVILDNRFEKRKTAFIIAGSIYLYNLLDALLFFPNYSDKGVGFSMNADFRTHALALGVQKKF